MTLRNGKDFSLKKSFGTLPSLSSTVASLSRPLAFHRITKTMKNHRVVETSQVFYFSGTWEPLKSSQIMLKPEMQRSWKWYVVRTDAALVLQNDDVIVYDEKSYRVESNTDFSDYGYFEYELVEDYTA